MDTAFINLPLGFQSSDMTNTQESWTSLRFPNPFNSALATPVPNDLTVVTDQKESRIGEFVWHIYDVWQARRDVCKAYKRIDRKPNDENI